jgi:pyruvate, water dikinase
MTAVPLEDATDESVFGGKAVSLGRALRARLPVPRGIALPADVVDQIARSIGGSVQALLASPHVPGGRVAVRSSAIGEDSGGASFAGQHATRLNVTRAQLPSAVQAVWASARSDSALAYRKRKGLSPEPRMAVVIQELVDPVAAGVLFTRNPITGADECLIEAAWGLGESVVNGSVTPDRFRLDAQGRLIERVLGEKDIRVVCDAGDGTVETSVDAAMQQAFCLRDDQVAALHALASRCRDLWGHDLDLEWALGAGDALYLLQSRPITTRPGGIV